MILPAAREIFFVLGRCAVLDRGGGGFNPHATPQRTIKNCSAPIKIPRDAARPV
jgi:hypothetical protein